MEIKKTSEADLENKKGGFLEIGLVLALGMLLVAFEWSASDIKPPSMGSLIIENYEADEIPITRQEEIKPPPPPPPKPLVVEILDIVNNEAIIDKVLDLPETETSNGTPLVFIDIPPEPEFEDFHVYTRVDHMPDFPGGEIALTRYLAEKSRYPDIARDNGIQGRVLVQFVIDEKGRVTNVMLARSVHPALDREALRVVSSLPIWTPGEQRGKKVKVTYTVPIYFRLAN
jgi:periplasmic protein TonB